MSIAICLSGGTRTFVHTAPTLKEYFEGIKADVFLHLWEGEDDPAVLAKLHEIYNPKSVLTTNRPDAALVKRQLAGRFSARPNPFSLDMFYAIEQGMASVPTAQYTHIVRARFDTIFKGRCPSGVLPFDPSTIVVPNNFTPPKGCNDQFAVGSEQAMRIYAGMYDWITRFITDKDKLPDMLFASNPTEFRPEQALMRYLQLTSLHIVQAPLHMTLLREADIEKAFSELPQDVNQGNNVAYEKLKEARDEWAMKGKPERSPLVRNARPPEKTL